MIGIYKIIDLRSNKTLYVGQSVNIERRWTEHCNKDLTIDKYIQTNGIKNFTYEIIEECPLDKLEEREIYWTIKLNTLAPNGFNNCLGTLVNNSIGENNSNTELTDEQVIQIRKFNTNLTINEGWKTYKNLLSFDAYSKIIRGETWTHLPIFGYNTESRHERKRAKLTEQDVVDIRKRFTNGEKIYDIMKIYDFVTSITIRRIINYQTWKNIDTPENREFKNNKFPASKLTVDNVKDIRQRFDAGESIAKIALDFPVVSSSTISNVAKRKTWKNIK